jgi:hypothetical protein
MNDDHLEGGFPPVSDPYGNGDEPEGPPPSEPLNLPPWEDRGRYTLLTGFLETIRLVMMEPRTFFKDHPVRRNILPPVLFALLMGVLGAVVEWSWSRVFSDLQSSLDTLLGQYETSGQQGVSPALIEFLEKQGETLGMLISPLTVLIMLFVLTGLIHLGVMFATKNRDRGFEATLRVVAYSEALNILILIPGCGGLIALFWGLAVKVVGLRELHGLGTLGALLAILLPLLLCCCGFVGLVGMIGAFTGAFSG